MLWSLFYKTLSLSIFFAVLPAYCQLFSVGVKGGVPLTDAYSKGSYGIAFTTPDARRYIVGPTAELHLPFHFSVEADALYRRNGFDYGVSAIAVTNKITVNDWQISFLGKYEPGTGPIRPFVDAGIAYRHVSLSYRTPFGPTDADNPSTAGFTIGGGIELKLLFFRLYPEIRYTRWPTSPFAATSAVSSEANQADFLVGLTF
jgi:opacity protein-like surface antigen